MKRPPPAPRRPGPRRGQQTRTVGHARVHGTVRPRAPLSVLLHRALRRRVRMRVDKLLLRPQRRDLSYRAAVAKDRASLGPQRRAVHRVLVPRDHVHHVDASRPQADPACHLYVGQPPWSVPTKRNGQPKRGVGYCPSCHEEVGLGWRGRLVKHEPGPPPYTHCWHCGGRLDAWYPWLRKRGGAYNDVTCPNYVDDVERESTARGDTSWSDR